MHQRFGRRARLRVRSANSALPNVRRKSIICPVTWLRCSGTAVLGFDSVEKFNSTGNAIWLVV
jgi:hypothetical protein